MFLGYVLQRLEIGIEVVRWLNEIRATNPTLGSGIVWWGGICTQADGQTEAKFWLADDVSTEGIRHLPVLNGHHVCQFHLRSSRLVIGSGFDRQANEISSPGSNVPLLWRRNVNHKEWPGRTMQVILIPAEYILRKSQLDHIKSLV